MEELMRVMTPKPRNAETPRSYLKSWITANKVFFDRNQGEIPEKEIDLAVHSLKDLPTDHVDGLALAAVPDHAEAGTGLAALLISRGETTEALDVLSRLTPNPEVERLQAAARVAASNS